MTHHLTVRPAHSDDAAAITVIYNAYIRESIATFEVVPIDAEEMERRMQRVWERGLPWLVAEDSELATQARTESAVVGYAYAGPFRDRVAYDHTLETTVYVHPDARGRGVGTELYEALFAALTDLDPAHSIHAPVHALLGVLALPNESSVALHERFEMTKVAHLPAVGRKFDRWIDVGYWQRTLEGNE